MIEFIVIVGGIIAYTQLRQLKKVLKVLDEIDGTIDRINNK